MQWRQGGPRRASPTSARWRRLGRISIARLRVDGDRPLRLLVIGGRAALDELDRDGADLGSGIANALASISGRGVELDLLADAPTVLPGIHADDRFWRLWRYEALVILLPADPVERRRVEHLLEPVLPRIRSQSAVLLAHDLAAPELLPPAGPADHPVGAVAIDGAGAAAAAESVAAALAALMAWQAPRIEGRWAGASAALQSVRRAAGPGLDRVVVIARRSFGIDVAAVNLVAADDILTVAAAGGDLGSRPRRASLFDARRTGALDVVPDTWQAPALRELPVVQGPGGIRFYASHLIASAAGPPAGALCLYDRRPHSAEEFDFTMLRDLAQLAEAELIGSSG